MADIEVNPTPRSTSEINENQPKEEEKFEPKHPIEAEDSVEQTCIFPSQFDGYEGVGSEWGDSIPPPTQFIDPKLVSDQIAAANRSISNKSPSETTGEQINDMVMEWLKTQHGEKYANKAEILKTATDTMPRYTFKTFYEDRRARIQVSPLRNASVFGQSKSRDNPPLPWGISVTNKIPFQVEDVIMRVPNTDEVYRCKKCPGTAKITCVLCKGKGYLSCETCRLIRQGFMQSVTKCSLCSGNLLKPCAVCSASGKVWCNECNGTAYVDSSIEVRASFRIATSRHTTSGDEVPPAILSSAKGNPIYADVRQKAIPVPHVTDEKVHGISKEMIKDHLHYLRKNRILYQIQLFESIPLTRVVVQRKKEIVEVIVFGTDKQIFSRPSRPRPK